MQRLVLTWMAIVLVATSALTLRLDAQNGRSSDEEDVLLVHRQLTEALTNNDVGTLEKLLAPGVMFIGNDGRRSTKAERIEEFRSGNRQYATEQVENLSVRTFGTIAIVAWDSQLAGVRNGAAFKTRSALTRVYEQRDGQWRLVHQQSGRVQ